MGLIVWRDHRNSSGRPKKRQPPPTGEARRSRNKETFVQEPSHPTAALRSDTDLIERAQRGDEKAFEALFHTYKRRVYGLCLRMTGNAADAEEVTQEAFLTLFRKIHTFRGESAFSTWLLRITLNIVLMRRRKKKLPEVPLEVP